MKSIEKKNREKNHKNMNAPSEFFRQNEYEKRGSKYGQADFCEEKEFVNIQSIVNPQSKLRSKIRLLLRNINRQIFAKKKKIARTFRVFQTKNWKEMLKFSMGWFFCIFAFKPWIGWWFSWRKIPKNRQKNLAGTWVRSEIFRRKNKCGR